MAALLTTTYKLRASFGASLRRRLRATLCLLVATFVPPSTNVTDPPRDVPTSDVLGRGGQATFLRARIDLPSSLSKNSKRATASIEKLTT